jgi:serine protease Do
LSGEEILDVLESVSRSVVHINTVRVVQDYYNRRFPLKGSGSGFIFDSEGYIVTNAHVIRNADKIGVVLHGNKPVEGTILGVCKSIDIAVVKVDPAELQAADLGDSDKVRVGQRVYAIGNPFGLVGGPTVTSGVISALDRSIESPETSMRSLVQTDAAINPGNSGGPLVDTAGRVIAINTAIIPYAQGIGFAIPINTAMECAEQIKTHGTVMRPWIGIYGVSITPQVASYYRLGVDSGVLVTNIVGGSPAQKSGISSGDVILSLNNAKIRDITDLKEALESHRVGDRISVTIARGRQRGTVNLMVEGNP